MGQTSFPVNAILVTSAGLVGSSTGTGAGVMLTAAQARSLLSVYTTAEVDTLLAGKSDTGHTHAASAITSGTIDTARLGSGTANASSYLRGDQTWATVSASTAWGGITGTLSDQADLQSALDAKQTSDATLVALAAVSTAADKLIYATGSDAFSTTDLTTFGRSLIDDADASTARTTLGLGTMATQASTSYLALTGGTLSGQLTSANIIPATHATYSLGSSGARFANGYFSSAVLTGSFSVNGNVLLRANSADTITVRNAADSAKGHVDAQNGIFGGTLAVTGASTLSSTLAVTGAATFSSTIAHRGFTIEGLSSTSAVRSQGQLVGSWVDSTDASRKAQVEEKVYDTAARTVARSFANGTNGYKAFKVLTTAPADGDLAVSEVVFYTDGSGNLAIKLKDSGGTVRTGTVTLA